MLVIFTFSRKKEARSLPSKYQVTSDLVEATNFFWRRNLNRCKPLNILESWKWCFIDKTIKFDATSFKSLMTISTYTSSCRLRKPLNHVFQKKHEKKCKDFVKKNLQATTKQKSNNTYSTWRFWCECGMPLKVLKKKSKKEQKTLENLC